MEFANLSAFVAVATRSSFSKAAAQLHLTQPAVSKRIGALEADLDVALFDRIGRQVKLTEAGHTLLPVARRVLAELDSGRRAVSNLNGAVRGRLTLATSHHIGLHRLPPVLRRFAARYGDVQLEMLFTDSEVGCQAVARGECELAIVTLPLTPQGPIEWLPIWDDPLTVVINADHPLAALERTTPAKLAGYPAILPGEVTFTRRLIDRFFGDHGVDLRVAFATNYLETIKMMVCVGLGWSVLPATMIDHELRPLALDDFAVSRTLGIVRHTNQTLSNAGQALVELLCLEAAMPAGQWRRE